MEYANMLMNFKHKPKHAHTQLHIIYKDICTHHIPYNVCTHSGTL